MYPSAVIAGKYRLESKIGEGGMGSVWRATHLRLDKPVAVKIVSPSHAASFDARWRFQSEARAAAKLQSKNVVHIEDIGELEDGTPFLVMELLSGLSLEQRIARDGPLQLPEAARIIGQVCRVLSRAHAAGIVHRDIKPENLFLAYMKDEDNPVVKVLDFGVAKSVDAASTSTTQSGALVGTPMFASPEQARARKDIDGRSDLYSLGLVTYVMLTGRDPFQAESLADLIIQICTGPLPHLREAAPHPMPPAMEDWFARACARDPAHRFPDADAFSEAFAQAAGLPQTSRPGPASDGQLIVPSEISGPVALAPRSTRTLAHAQTLEAHVRAPTSRPSHVPALLLLAAVALVGAAGVGVIVLRPVPGHRTPASPAASAPLVSSSTQEPAAVSVVLAPPAATPVASAPSATASASASATAVTSRPARTTPVAVPPTPAPHPVVPKKPDLGY